MLLNWRLRAREWVLINVNWQERNCTNAPTPSCLPSSASPVLSQHRRRFRREDSLATENSSLPPSEALGWEDMASGRRC
jgi:hypothetical protein